MVPTLYWVNTCRRRRVNSSSSMGSSPTISTNWSSTRRGVELAPTGMDQMGIELQNLYAALAQPTQGLTVSWPAADVSGAELRRRQRAPPGTADSRAGRGAVSR